jgi:hypothetical protein
LIYHNSLHLFITIRSIYLTPTTLFHLHQTFTIHHSLSCFHHFFTAPAHNRLAATIIIIQTLRLFSRRREPPFVIIEKIKKEEIKSTHENQMTQLMLTIYTSHKNPMTAN